MGSDAGAMLGSGKGGEAGCDTGCGIGGDAGGCLTLTRSRLGRLAFAVARGDSAIGGAVGSLTGSRACSGSKRASNTRRRERSELGSSRWGEKIQVKLQRT